MVFDLKKITRHIFLDSLTLTALLYTCCSLGCYKPDPLTERLVNPDDVVRSSALQEYYRLDRKSKGIALSSLLNHLKRAKWGRGDLSVLEIAANLKGEEEEYISVFIPLLGDEKLGDLMAAAMYKIGPSSIPQLEASLKNTTNPHLLAGIEEALGRVGHFQDSTIALLIAASKHPHWNVRLQAVEALRDNVRHEKEWADEF